MPQAEAGPSRPQNVEDSEKQAEATKTRDRIDELLRKSFKDTWKEEYPRVQHEEDWIRNRPNPWSETFADTLYHSINQAGMSFEPPQRVVPSSASPQPEHMEFPQTSDPSSSSVASESSDDEAVLSSSKALIMSKERKGRDAGATVKTSSGCTGWLRQPAFVFCDQKDTDSANHFKRFASLSNKPPKPKWQISTAKYDPLPSYDFVMPIFSSRPGENVEFDHHPLIFWEPLTYGRDNESSELRAFWEQALLQLESKPEELYFRSRDPFVDTARFNTAKAFLHEKCQISPDIMDELSAVNEIADDITLVVWLLNRHQVAEHVREPWTKFLLKSVKDLSDFFQKPLVEILDDHRVTWPEHKTRARVSQRPLSSAFRTLCPIHLHYMCPDHNDEFHDAEVGFKATSLTRDKSLPPEIREPSLKQCGSNCWLGLQKSDETLLQIDRMRHMSFDQLTAAWSKEDKVFFREIFPKFYKVTACQMALFMPGHNCYEFYFINQRAMEEGFDNPAQGHNPYTNEEKPAGAPTSPPKQHSRTIENADVETSNLSQTLHVLAHRPAEAKAAQANKAEASKRREEEMEDKPWKQLKPNENWGYSPCDHAGRTCEEAAKTDDCLCHGNRTWCDKFCHCPLDCPRRFPGCYNECHSKGGKCRTDSCPCYRLCRECDPEICNGRVKQATICGNMQLQTRAHKKNFVGISPVEGFGLFAGTAYKEGDLVEEYKGELISQEEAVARDVVFKRRRKTYFYELDRRKGIDSEFFGNRARYINAPPTGQGHQKRQRANCSARVYYVLGEHRIGVFCDSRKLQAGDELLMDYGPLYEFHDPA